MCITANFTTPTLCPFAWRVKTVWDAEVYGKFLSLHPIPVPQHQGLQGSGAAEPQSPYWASCIGKWGQIENNYGHIRCRREQQKIFFFCSILKELLLIHQFVGSCKWYWRLWFDDQKGEAVISLRSCSCSVWINKLFFRGYRKLSSWWAPWSCTSSYAFCEMKGWDLSCLNRISWRSLDKSFQKKKKICCLKIYLHILQRTFVFSKKKKKKIGKVFAQEGNAGGKEERWSGHWLPISLDFGHLKKLTQMWRFLSRDSPTALLITVATKGAPTYIWQGSYIVFNICLWLFSSRWLFSALGH